MNDLISIVVPIYNVEKYLCRCVDSILSQSYLNIEIILVDDGSTDNCSSICDHYSKVDNRVIVIHKKNGGLSDARNEGIKKSNGKYITFIDSDDYVHNDFITKLYNLLIKTKSDISCCDFFNFSETDEKIDFSNYKESFTYSDFAVEKVEALEKIMYRNKLRNSACAKLFKKELFNNIVFPKGKLCEDLGTMYKLFSLTNRVSMTHFRYYYMQRKHSIIHSNFNINRMDGLYFAVEQTNFISNNYPNIINAAYNREFMEAIYILMKIPNKNQYKVQLEEIYSSIKRTRKFILTDKKSSFKIKLLALTSYFGIFFLKTMVSFKNIN